MKNDFLVCTGESHKKEKFKFVNKNSDVVSGLKLSRLCTFAQID